MVGHSERRNIFDEDDREIRFKVQAALRNGLRPVLCVGETQLEREEGATKHVLNDQVVSGLLNVDSDQIGDVVIAYEPVWAIGNGQTAETDDIKQAVGLIRAQVGHMFGKKAAATVPILYGGSVNLDNARSILAVDNVDGLLIGTASLVAPEFAGMVSAANECAREERANQKD